MILTLSDTTGTYKQFGGTEDLLIKSQYFLRTIMEGSEDMILTPSDTPGTDKQICGTQDLWSSLIIFGIVMEGSEDRY